MEETKTKFNEIRTIFESIWRLRWAVVVVGVIMAALLGLIENLYLTGTIPTSALSPSMGMAHRQFEVQWDLLEKYVGAHGGVDVIVIGNSAALMGIDPDALEKWYQQAGGGSIRVFNFGVEGVALESASEIGQLLIQEYQPKAILFAGGIENFNPLAGTAASKAILDTGWMRYKMGQFSPTGWLAENSVGFQQYLITRNWMQADFETQMKIAQQLEERILGNGFYPNNSRVSSERDQAPSMEDARDAEIFAVYQGHVTGEENLNHFIELAAAAKKNGTNLIFVEIPKHATFYMYFEAYEQSRSEFFEETAGIFDNYGVVFIPVDESLIVDNDLYVDRSHMKPEGAMIFSQRLGELLEKMLPDLGE